MTTATIVIAWAAVRAALQRHGATPAIIRDLLADPRCWVCTSALVEHDEIVVEHEHRCCDRAASCGKCIRGLAHQRCNMLVANIDRSMRTCGVTALATALQAPGAALVAGNYGIRTAVFELGVSRVAAIVTLIDQATSYPLPATDLGGFYLVQLARLAELVADADAMGLDVAELRAGIIADALEHGVTVTAAAAALAVSASTVACWAIESDPLGYSESPSKT